MEHDVFISYSSTDQKIVEGLSAYLEQNGIRCFVAYRDIPRGVVWAKAITEAIENCKLMIVVFSEHFNRSEQVDREIEMCIEEGRPILTFRIQDTTFTGVKKYYLKNINWIDAFPNPQECFGELLKSVIALLPSIKDDVMKVEEWKQTAENETAKHDLITSKSYGVGTFDTDRNEAAMCLLIPKSSTVPYTAKVRFCTAFDNQISMIISIYESDRIETYIPLIDANLLEEIELKFDPTPKGIPIDIYITIIETGYLEMKAVNLERGISSNLQLKVGIVKQSKTQ